jgi:flagellar basal body-associated protein FliL
MDHSKSTRKRRRHCILLWVLIALLVFILAAVVPMAVLLPRDKKASHKSSVMLPLYIYPHDNSTWQPLYDS